MFVAYVPAIEGCHAQGATAEEARAELDGVFDMVVEHYLENQWPFPPDVRELVPVAS